MRPASALGLARKNPFYKAGNVDSFMGMNRVPHGIVSPFDLVFEFHEFILAEPSEHHGYRFVLGAMPHENGYALIGLTSFLLSAAGYR